MIIFPAIDLYGGQAVRLFQGDYDQMTVYDKEPSHTVRIFEEAGATHLHLVDLEGAKTGKTTNLPVIAALAKGTDRFIQVGGGIRSMETIEAYLSAGVNRVILGTAAVKNPDFAAVAVKQYGEKIAVGVDIKDGKVAINGWTETTPYLCDEFCERMQDLGVSTIICTDISKDGVMQGTNRALYEHLTKTFSMQVIASGGVSSLEDIRALRDAGVHGAIIGKAYYTGAIDLAKAVELGGGEP
jgi:phosphoribosylformimino-5-aminoimidazole carboxamide ribotide isomerase